MTDANVSLIGNLTRDLDLKFSNGGNAYARGGMAVNRRKRVGDDWEDETSFFDFSILDGQMAQNAADSLAKGDRVVLTGWLQQRTVETDGDKRSYVGVIVTEIGPSLRWATTSIIKNPKKEGGPSTSTKGGDFFDESNFD